MNGPETQGKGSVPEGEASQPVWRLLREARERFRRGENDEAKAICARLLDEGVEAREVFVLLADIYRFEGNRALAEDMLRRAAQAPPAVGGEDTGKAAALARPRQIWLAPPTPVLWPTAVGGIVLALAAAVGIRWVPERFDWFGLNPFDLLLVAAAGFLGAGSLAASGAIRTFDQELTEVGPLEDFPLWLYLLLAGVASAWLGALIYAWAVWLKGELSPTPLAYLGALLVLGGVIGWSMGGGLVFWWFGLNLLWESALVGWAIGSMGSPREWWQR